MQLHAKQHAAHCVLCLRALSAAQVEVDTSRMVLAFYCLAALDVLGMLESSTKEDERNAWREWIWQQQVETKWGTAFRAGPAVGTSSSTSSSDAQASQTGPGPDYDPPHMIMTFAAILSLSILRDPLTRLARPGLRDFLSKMQQPDGSFQTHHGSGENDLRATYCAFVLCDLLGAPGWEAISVPRALGFIESCRAYEGGYGQTPRLESHGGPTFCAVACLALCPPEYKPSPTSQKTTNDDSRLLRWLLQRQIGGFQGRTNKTPDACYSFWCGGALKILGAGGFVDKEANAGFLNECQFRFGGIAKAPGETPDPFHTYMSLATLSMYPPTGDNDSPPFQLRKMDVALNATVETAQWAKDHVPAPLNPLS